MRLRTGLARCPWGRGRRGQRRRCLHTLSRRAHGLSFRTSTWRHTGTRDSTCFSTASHLLPPGAASSCRHSPLLTHSATTSRWEYSKEPSRYQMRLRVDLPPTCAKRGHFSPKRSSSPPRVHRSSSASSSHCARSIRPPWGAGATARSDGPVHTRLVTRTSPPVWRWRPITSRGRKGRLRGRSSCTCVGRWCTEDTSRTRGTGACAPHTFTPSSGTPCSWRPQLSPASHAPLPPWSTPTSPGSLRAPCHRTPLNCSGSRGRRRTLSWPHRAAPSCRRCAGCSPPPRWTSGRAQKSPRSEG
mmetsp:Transcript_65500/g.207035  ORF Transcript_65500/g.207035 Transcript_65500/m.207035 type:complete len:300 (-) Transcript_65500:327-1226(-)